MSLPPTETTPRYDQKTAQEAIALAARLQDEHRETMTVAQVEAIAADIGVEPEFVRAALAKVEAKNAPRPSRGAVVTQFLSARDERRAARRIRARARLSQLQNIPPGLWWAIGWIPPVTAAILEAPENWVPSSFLLYIGMGIFLSVMSGQRRKEVNALGQANVSREQLLETLFTVQQQLAQDETTRAFLSIDVVGSSEMKQNASSLASEYSFGQYRRWVEERVRSEGGQIQSAAGDGIMCVFDSEAKALGTANRLLDDLPRFNQEQNRLAQPFRIRCGVNAGKVAAPEGTPLGNWQSTVIDRAALLQKQAEPNTVSVGTGS